jgi:hypothetical protein
MWTGNDAIVTDLLAQLLEAELIGRDLAAIEHVYGPNEVIEDVWRRHRRLCDQLLEQLRHLLSAGWRYVRRQRNAHPKAKVNRRKRSRSL